MRNENVIIEIWSNAYDRMTTMTSIQIYDDDNDTDTDDDGREVVVNDPPRLCWGLEVPQQGGGQTAAVALLQDVLANCVRVIEVTSQFARVHNLRFILTHPGSEKQIVQL